MRQITFKGFKARKSLSRAWQAECNHSRVDMLAILATLTFLASLTLVCGYTELWMAAMELLLLGGLLAAVSLFVDDALGYQRYFWEKLHKSPFRDFQHRSWTSFTFWRRTIWFSLAGALGTSVFGEPASLWPLLSYFAVGLAVLVIDIAVVAWSRRRRAEAHTSA